MGLSRDAGPEIEDGARRSKEEKEERKGNATLLSVPCPRVMSEPQGQEGTEQILNAFPVGPPLSSLHLAPGYFSCLCLSPQTPLLQQSCDLFFLGGRIIHLPPPREHCPFLTCNGPQFRPGHWRPSNQPHRESDPHQNSPFLPMT